MRFAREAKVEFNTQRMIYTMAKKKKATKKKKAAKKRR